MTTYRDPSRPKTPSGLPAYLTNPNIIIPRLIITPASATGIWEVLIFLAKEDYSAEGTTIYVGNSLMIDLFYDWQNDPEQALKKWFNLEPPSRSLPQPSTNLTTAKTLDELGL